MERNKCKTKEQSKLVILIQLGSMELYIINPFFLPFLYFFHGAFNSQGLSSKKTAHSN